MPLRNLTGRYIGMAAFYANGASVALVAEVFGLGTETIRSYIKEIKRHLLPNGRGTRIELLKALDARLENTMDYDNVDGYACPVDPAEREMCDSCQ